MKTQEQIILDIGCGQKKMEGAIGIDFSPYSVADIVLDLNKENLPFEDSSVDFIYTSHALEHLSWGGFMHCISEMYRVSKPDSQIYITVPYFQNTLNFANPFHNNKICFNEHTFRFFSSTQECKALKKEEYQTPTCPDWGLRYSANAELNIELETLKIDYLYFSQYTDLLEVEKTKLKSTYLNIVENITYWLKVIKPAPKLITKKSQFEISHHEEIVKQLSYIDSQLNYIYDQKKFIITNNLKVDESDLKIPSKITFARQDNLYIDEFGILYPAVDIFWQYQNFIQNNQKIIDNR